MAWSRNVEIKDRLLEEGHKGLILAPEGEKVPIAIQATAILNDSFIIPIVIQMKAARSLKIPSLDSLEEELSLTWVKYFEAKERKSANATGRCPKLPDDFKLSPAIQACCRVDAKYVKSLLSMVKKQFMSDRQARESQHYLSSARLFLISVKSFPSIACNPRMQTTVASSPILERRHTGYFQGLVTLSSCTEIFCSRLIVFMWFWQAHYPELDESAAPARASAWGRASASENHGQASGPEGALDAEHREASGPEGALDAEHREASDPQGALDDRHGEASDPHGALDDRHGEASADDADEISKMIAEIEDTPRATATATKSKAKKKTTSLR